MTDKAVGGKPATNHLATIEETINGFLRRIRSVSECASEYVGHATDSCVRELKHVAMEMKSITTGLQAADRTKDEEVQLFEKTLTLSKRVLERFSYPHFEILSQSLFVAAFSNLDAYVSSLVRLLYQLDPRLLRGVNRDCKLSDLVACTDLDSAVAMLVDQEIESMIRESYVELFKRLEMRFNISTLREFPNWPKFVESAQRRNAVTHCGATVTQQYLKNCDGVGYIFTSRPNLGDSLKVESSYLQASLDLLFEVGFKLGQTLWRKQMPDELAAADDHLIGTVYGLLVDESWGLALELGKFGMSQHHASDDRNRRIIVINCAQAARWSGDTELMNEILSQCDWTASIRDFRLCVAVLRHEFMAAAQLMRAIGKEGEFVGKDAYLDWPVFREFRKSPRFKRAFRDIYGTVPRSSNQRRRKRAKVLVQTKRGSSDTKAIKTKKKRRPR